MKTIVFGGTGWVGHHIVKAFCNAGHDVTICTRGKNTTYQDDIPANLPVATCDKQVEQDVAAVLETSYDVVVDSVPTLQSIAHIAKHAKNLKHYLHCGSTGGYAPLPTVPGDETLPYDHFCGGWAEKGDADNKALDLYREQGFPVTVLRPSYITGPGLLPLDNIGGRREDFVADILNNVVMDLPENGLSLLQPIHVQDLGDSFLLAAQRPEISIGEIYNICLDRAVTLNRYLELNAAALDREVTINYMSIDAILGKYGDAVHETGLRFLATHMCYDISKAKTQLDYQPHCTVEEAIAENVRWAATQS
jgi:nucleoside-diphosphate-sugar epimerase